MIVTWVTFIITHLTQNNVINRTKSDQSKLNFVCIITLAVYDLNRNLSWPYLYMHFLILFYDCILFYYILLPYNGIMITPHRPIRLSPMEAESLLWQLWELRSMLLSVTPIKLLTSFHSKGNTHEQTSPTEGHQRPYGWVCWGLLEVQHCRQWSMPLRVGSWMPGSH